MQFKNHNLTEYMDYAGVLYEEIPLKDPNGDFVDGLHSVRITLDNPKQLNSYTTDMVKGVIMGMRREANDRACVAEGFTGRGNRRSFHGGNHTAEHRHYTGMPATEEQ